MYKYKNKNTGETILVSSEISGGGWEKVDGECEKEKDPKKQKRPRDKE